MSSPCRLVLIEGMGRRLDDVRRALSEESQVEVDVAPNVDSMWGAVGSGSPHVWVVDFDGLSTDDRHKLTEHCARTRPTNPVVMLAERPTRDTLVTLFGKHALTHLLARNEAVDATDLRVTVAKLTGGSEIFGLARYFEPGAARWTSSLARASERVDCLSNIEGFASSHSVPNRRVELLRTVADEFITNALYDAPVDAHGAPRYRHVQRDTDVALSQQEQPLIEVCCDGRRIGISVSDPFGSLAPDQLFDYLAKGLRKEADQIDDKAGGAGLGLYSAFSASSHFVVNVAKGKRTEMISILDHASSHRQYSSGHKSFNLFLA